MKVRIASKIAKNGVLLYPIFEKEAVAEGWLKRALTDLRRTKEFEGKEGQLLLLRSPNRSLPAKVLLAGFGNAKKITVSSVLSNSGAAVRQSASYKTKTVQIVVPTALAAYAGSIVEAAALAAYQAQAPFKTGDELKKIREKQIEEVVLVGKGMVLPAAEKGLKIAASTNEVRDWINAPQNKAHVEFFEQRAREIAKETGVKLTVLNKKDIAKLNMGALLGVNRGSNYEPRLIVIDYHPKNAPNADSPIVLVGKGIVFDSGGYNLKPSGHIEDMHLDKSGAAVVIEMARLLGKLQFPRRVVCVAPLTDNVIGPDALKPADIVTTHAGKTIEITNTDAEGRLVLADALSYAVATYKPQYIIDVATLTGACMIALGHRYAGLFGNDLKLVEALRCAGEATDELLWPLPIHKDDAEKMKGEYADLRNSDSGTSRYAGASKGAAFLQEFVGKTKWAHLDIAGPAYTTDPKKYESKGATGFGVRVLLKFLEHID